MAVPDEVPAEFLWALVEGKMDDEAARALCAYLRACPAARRHLRLVVAHHLILSRGDARVLDEPVPARLIRLIERARRRLRESS